MKKPEFKKQPLLYQQISQHSTLNFSLKLFNPIKILSLPREKERPPRQTYLSSISPSLTPLFHFSFTKRCQRSASRGCKQKRKQETEKGRKEGRKGVEIVVGVVQLHRFEGDALQEARGRSSCKGIVTWLRGRYRFLVGIKERRSTGASTNYYYTLPPGRRRETVLHPLQAWCVSRCPFTRKTSSSLCSLFDRFIKRRDLTPFVEGAIIF